MHFTPSLIPLSYQFYASIVLVSVLGGVGAFCLTLVAVYGLGGIELVLAMLFVSSFGLLRLVIPSWSRTTATDQYDPCEFWEERKIEDFAIDTFVLNKSEKATDPRIGICCPICLYEYQTGDEVSIVTACQHAYHTECLKMWLPRSPTCPYCRSALELKCTDQKYSSQVRKNGAWGIFEGIFESASVVQSIHS